MTAILLVLLYVVLVALDALAGEVLTAELVTVERALRGLLELLQALT